MNIQSVSSEKREIKAVVADLDGTLLNDSHTLSEGNREAIKKAMDHGIKVILATGKTRISAESLIASLNLDTPGVFVQGTVIYNPDGSIRHQHTMNANAARRIIHFAESNGFDVIAYHGNRLIARHNDEPISFITAWGEPNPHPVGPLVNVLGTTQVNKLLITGGSAHRLTALRWQLNQQVGTQVSFTTTAVASTLEILPKGTSKASGVRFALKELGIAPEHVMAIGDAENDIEMLQMAGLGVAVSNASEAAKKAANVIVSSNNDDGVAEAIEKYALPAAKTEATAAAPAADTDSESSQS